MKRWYDEETGREYKVKKKKHKEDGNMLKGLIALGVIGVGLTFGGYKVYGMGHSSGRQAMAEEAKGIIRRMAEDCKGEINNYDVRLRTFLDESKKLSIEATNKKASGYQSQLGMMARQ